MSSFHQIFYGSSKRIQENKKVTMADEQELQMNFQTQMMRNAPRKPSRKKKFNRASTIIDEDEYAGWAFEDSRITRLIFEKYRLIELSRFWFILASMVLTLLQFEYSYQTYMKNNMEQQLQILLHLIFYMTIIIILLTVIAYIIELEYRKKAKVISKMTSFWHTDLKWELLTEFLIILPTSTPFTDQYYVTFEQRGTFVLRFYYVNEILTYIMLFRLYLVLKIGFKFQSYYSNRIGRLCRLYSTKFGTHLMLKLCIRRYPFSTLSWLFIVGFIQYSYQLEIAERPLQRDFESLNKYSIDNNLWVTMITIATVGYGDFYPYTDLGRLAMTLGLFYGVSITSLFTAILYNMLSPTKEEYQCWALLDKAQVTINIKQASTRIFYYLNKLRQERVAAKTLNIPQETYTLFTLESYLSQVGMYRRLYRDIDGEEFMDRVRRKFYEANLFYKDYKYFLCKMMNQQFLISRNTLECDVLTSSNIKQPTKQSPKIDEKFSKDEQFFNNLNDLEPDPYLMSFND